ncbi:MAG: helix-turn-helix domain-containing protein [Pseudomonadota bacterium]|nr:helix-turn-helix domain-containing protein [Pseudomonadota bacterium]
MREPASRTINVWVVLPARVLLLDIAGPMEVLRRANVEQRAFEFKVHYAGSNSRAMSSVGIPLADIAPLPGTLPSGAVIVVPGSADKIAFAEDDTQAAVNQDEHAIVDWLRASVRSGHTLITICSGALLAARAGLLDGYSCTTHHAECEELAALAPHAKVLDNRLFVIDGERYTSAGVTAGLDLMLHVVSDLVGHVCALAIARHLVLYLRRQGADPQLSPWLAGRNHMHPAVHRVQDAIIANPAAEWTLARLALIASTSPRHLSRLFNEHTNMSTTAYINSLRVALAHQLIKTSRLGLERIAERTGFASSRQLRRAWRRSYDMPPIALRSSSRSLTAVNLQADVLST